MIKTKTVISEDGHEKEIVIECSENDNYCHGKCLYRQGSKTKECSLYPYNMMASAMVSIITILFATILIVSIILKK